MQQLEILVVGAGIGGLAAAAGLQKIGHHVSVFEQAPALGEIGAGIMLTPNAVRALDFIGALPEVKKTAVKPEMSYSRHFRTGELLGERAVAGSYEIDFGESMYNIHRADLHRALAHTLMEGDTHCLHMGHTFESLMQDAHGVHASFANAKSYSGDVLIGSDGIRSSVRSKGLGVDSPSRFTNFVAWRGLVPLDRLPATLRSTSMTSWVSPDRHIIEYAVGNLKNYVALALQPGWQSEAWSTPSTVAEVLETFPDWHDDITTIIKSTPAGGSYKFALHDRDPMTRWTNGLVTLLGDAAHPMLPLMAQGAAMALEDAAIITRAFATAASSEEALRRYEAARKARTAWAQLESRAARDAYHSTEKDRWRQATEARSKVLYSYDVTTLPI